MGWEVASEAPAPKVDTHQDFHALMDSTFGKGKWHQKGGYRTPERENELRAEGAGTVKPGKTSDHSKGTPENPGAYDIVVDGLNPRQVARRLQETGADFVHFYPEGQRATQGAHLHVSVPTGAASGAKPHAGGDEWQVASEAPINKPQGKPQAKPPEKRSTLGQIADTFMDVPREAVHATREAQAEFNKEWKKPVDTRPSNLGLGYLYKGLELALDDLGIFGAPLTGALTSIVGRPVETATGGRVSKRIVGNVAALALPFAGEAKGAVELNAVTKETGLGANAARRLIETRRAPAPAVVAPKAGVPAVAHKPGYAETAAAVGPVNAAKALAQPVDAAHAARVARLEKDDIFVTPGMRLGGKAKIIEDASTSNPTRGHAVVEARNRSIESMNTALYNKALAPIGGKMPDGIPVGREGVKAVGAKLSAAYNAILPKVVVTIDDEALNGLASLEKASDKLGAPQAAQFRAIVNQDVLHHLPIGETSNGEKFKAVESDLLRQSRAFKGSQDPNQRAMGHMLDDVLDVVTDAAERHSPSGVRDQLKKVNTGYAIFTRIQDAATRRIATQPGVNPGTITPGDLVAAVRKGDRTVRKGAFARGDALLQGFAEDAEAVLPSKVSDSGTATRLNVTRPGMIGAAVGGSMGGVPGAAAGAVAGIADQGLSAGTNALARHLLMRTVNNSATVPGKGNYLLQASRRLQANDYGRTAAQLGAVSGANNQANGQ